MELAPSLAVVPRFGRGLKPIPCNPLSTTMGANMQSHQRDSRADSRQINQIQALTLDDRQWASRNATWRERAPALPWPPELLEAFSLRMASHGMSICRALMLSDKCYALQQLAHGQTLGDDTLRLMSVQLFRHFESRQAGLPSVH